MGSRIASPRATASPDPWSRAHHLAPSAGAPGSADAPLAPTAGPDGSDGCSPCLEVSGPCKVQAWAQLLCPADCLLLWPGALECPSFPF